MVPAIDFEQYALATYMYVLCQCHYYASYVCVAVEYAMLCFMVKGVSTMCFTSS